MTMNRVEIYAVLPNIFELFFPGKQYSVKNTRSNIEDESEWYCIENGVKYCVKYDFIENHLEVLSVTQYSFDMLTYIEGSPEDIIKVAKLLQ